MVRQITIQWGAAGNAGGFTTLNFDDGVAPAGLISAFNAFGAALDQNLASTTSMTLLGEYRDLDDVTGALTGIASFAPPASIPGTGGATAVANAAQGLIRIRTNQIVRGRLLQGRIFVPGMSTNVQLGTGEVNATGVAALQAAGDALVLNGAYGVWHRPVNGGGGSFALATSAGSWNEFAVQRRRRS